MTNAKHERDHDDDRNEHDNDNGYQREGRAIAPAPAAGALTSLTALTAALNAVDMTTVSGRSNMPMLLFKSREGGIWTYGQRETVPEEGSCWAVNPLTFKWGFICFSDGKKALGEQMVPVSQQKPDVTALPDKGFPWQEQWSVSMKCTSGTDAGTEVVFKSTTVGGAQAIAGLIEAVRDRLNGGQHDGKVSPILTLGKDSYDGPHGRVWYPVLGITDWMSLDGPAPAPAPTPASPPPAEQPRRRRVI